MNEEKLKLHIFHQTYFFCETIDGKLCWRLEHRVRLWDGDYRTGAATNLETFLRLSECTNKYLYLPQ